MEKWWIVHGLFASDKGLFEFFEILFDLTDVFGNIVHFDLEFFKFCFIDIGFLDIIDGVSELVITLCYLPGSWDRKTQQSNECSEGNRDRIIFETKVHRYLELSGKASFISLGFASSGRWSPSYGNGSVIE